MLNKQFREEITVLKEMIASKTVRQFEEYKKTVFLEDIKRSTLTNEDFSFEKNVIQLGFVNSIVRAVDNNDFSEFTENELYTRNFIKEIKKEFPGFTQTMDAFEKRVFEPEELTKAPKFKTNSWYQDKAQENLEDLLKIIEGTIEELKNTSANSKRAMYSKQASMVDMMLSAIITNDPNYLSGSMVENIDGFISDAIREYPKYVEDLLWVKNIFMVREQVREIIVEYNLPFTIESLETEILTPYKQISKDYERCIDAFVRTEEPTELLKKEINDFRVVLHYIDFAIS